MPDPRTPSAALREEILKLCLEFNPSAESCEATVNHFLEIIEDERREAVEDYKDAVFSRLCSENAPHRGQTHRILATVLETLYPSKP